MLTVLLMTCAVNSGMAQTPVLKIAATTDRGNWNGVAAANDKRLFADFPRFDQGSNPSLVEIKKDGSLVPYPSEKWNSWQPGAALDTHFVSLNAVYVNKADNHLWVVDAGAPFNGPDLTGAAKIVEIDLASNQVVNIFPFNRKVAPAGSQLNDLRIKDNIVYITESGNGAILVLDRQTKKIRRLLADSKVTKADPAIQPVKDGRKLEDGKGKVPLTNADQLELSPDGKTLYFMSPFGPNLYRVATADLLNESLTAAQLEEKVTVDRKVAPIGGLVMDDSGNLYLSEILTQSIRCEGPDKKTKWVITDERLKMPDAYSIAPDGTVYMVASQIVEMPKMQQGKDKRKAPYYIFSFKPG